MNNATIRSILDIQNVVRASINSLGHVVVTLRRHGQPGGVGAVIVVAQDGDVSFTTNWADFPTIELHTDGDTIHRVQQAVSARRRSSMPA